MTQSTPDRARPLLILPIELIQRELEGKLLLALEAIQRGYQVVIGEHERLNRRIKHLPTGAYLYKDAASWQAAKLFPKLRAAGQKVLALDEEGLIYASEELYLRSRVDERAISNLDVMLAWGEFHRKVLLRKQGMRPEIVRVVGNPRMDLCRLLAEPRQKSGVFTVLVNTRFAIINGHKPEDQVMESLRRLNVISNDADQKFFSDFAKRDKPLLEAFIAVTREISELGDNIRVIVRPHPAESAARYKEAFSGINNIVVDHQSPLSQHLAEADILLHEGCTTAIEAALMGKPSVALVLSPPLSETQALPNSFSHTCRSIDEVIEYVKTAHIDGLTSAPDISSEAKQALKNATGRYAFSLLMDVVDELGVEPVDSREMVSGLRRWQKITDFKLAYKRLVYLRILPHLLGKRPADISRHAASFDNKNAKFPSLSNSEFQDRLDAISRIFPGKAPASITRIDSQTILLTPN